MAKVVFCNIAWMKLYSGITDNDQPKMAVRLSKKIMMLVKVSISIRITITALGMCVHQGRG